MSDVRHTLAELRLAYPPLPASERIDRPSIAVGEVTLLTSDDLGLGAQDPIRSVIDEPAGDDGSRDALRCAGDMDRAGFTREQIVGVLLNPDNAVSAHIFRQDDPKRAARRIVERVVGDRERAEAAGDRGPGSSPNDNGVGAAAPFGARNQTSEAEPLDLIDAGSLAGVAVEPMAFTIQKLLPDRQLTLYTAPGGGGKSYTSLQMAASVALGALAFGLATVAGAAIYLSCEDDDDENHRRLIGIANGMNVGLAAFSARLFMKSLVGQRHNGLARIDQNNKMTVLPLFWQLRATIIAKGASFVVLDNVAHLFEGNENIRAHVAQFVGLLNSLAQETDCSILLIGHPNKAGDSYSGSTAWQNQVRSQLHLERVANDPDARTLTLAKANYAHLEEPIRVRWHRGAFRLESDIPAGENTTANVREQAEDSRFLACLAVLTGQKRPVSEHAAARDHFAPKAFVGLPEAQGMTEDHFKSALKRLLDTGRIETGELGFEKPGSRGHKATGLRLRIAVEVDHEPY